MNVLSLCDGMSCLQIVLKELGIKVDNYYASEIDKIPISVTQTNFPQTIQLGDVTKITPSILKTLPKIDLVAFGSPCRSLTRATMGRSKYNNGLKGISGLYYTCNDILDWIKKNNNPNVKFLMENVVPTHSEDLVEMNEIAGVQPHLINSNLFSAQDRERYYWTNIPVAELPVENPTVLKDILDDPKDVDDKYFYKCGFTKHEDDRKTIATLDINGHDILKRVSNIKYKSPTLTACRGGYKQKKVFIDGRCRKLTPHEYRKLQTIPKWYKMDVADSHIYNMCGDGWNIETIKHIIKSLKTEDN